MLRFENRLSGLLLVLVIVVYCARLFVVGSSCGGLVETVASRDALFISN